MLGWLLRHWRALAGSVWLTPAAIKGTLALINLGGDIDFIVSRSQDPGWVGTMINWIIDPPGWAILPIIALGFACIYWDIRSRGPSKLTAAATPETECMDSHDKSPAAPTKILIKITRFEFNGWPPNTVAVVFDLFNPWRPSILRNWELSLIARNGKRFDRLSPTQLITTHPRTEYIGPKHHTIYEDNTISPLESGGARIGAVFAYTHNSELDREFYGLNVRVHLCARDVWGNTIEGTYIMS